MSVTFDAEKFRIARKKKFTQAQLAEEADTSIRYVRDLEHGTKSNPSAAMLYQISSALEIPMEELMKAQKDEDDL